MRTLRFVTVMLTALTMGMAFSHLLQMPVKFAYSGPDWLLLQHTLYGNYRAFGVLVEIGALAGALGLLLRARHALGWTLLGALCLAAAHAAWWTLLVPLNGEIAALSPLALPAGWEELRLQWEYAHAMRFGLQAAALAALLAAVLAEPRARYASWLRARA